MKKSMICIGLISLLSLTILGGAVVFAKENVNPAPPFTRHKTAAPTANKEAVEAYQKLLVTKSEAIQNTATDLGIDTAGFELKDIVKAIGDKSRDKTHELGLTAPPRPEGAGRPKAQAPAAPAIDSNNAEQAADTVVISGGFNSDPQDKGRPVVLIAAALGVPTEVFREAFRGVTPAGLERGPTAEEAQRNKAALLNVLARYGITNERLDEVSDFYRYNGSNGGTWPRTQAAANVTITDEVVTGVTITNPGAGYTSNPTITVMGPSGKITATATLSYTKDFKTNGSISAITIKLLCKKKTWGSQ